MTVADMKSRTSWRDVTGARFLVEPPVRAKDKDDDPEPWPPKRPWEPRGEPEPELPPEPEPEPPPEPEP